MNIRDLLAQPRDLFEPFCRSKTSYAYLGEGRGLARVLGKYLVYVDPLDTSVVPHLIVDGFWEAWVTLALSRLKPAAGAYALDVGANHGYYTMILSELFDRVVAFEPQEKLAALLQDSVRVNGYRNKTTVSKSAVSGAPSWGLLEFVEDEPHNLGAVRLVEGASPGEEHVVCVTIDGLFKDQSVGFIKMDAEGAEADIWAGARQTIEAQRPVILMEFTPQAYKDAEGFLSEIQAWYPLREVDEDGGLKPVTASEVLDREDFSMLWLEATK